MSTTIDSLSMQIEASSAGAAAQIDRLSVSLNQLKSNSKLTTVVNNLGKLNTALEGLRTSSAGLQGIKSISDALNGLQSIGKVTNLTSALNQLKKIPEITKQLNTSTLDAFGNAMQRLNTGITPPASNMAKISAGFAKLPASIRGSTNAMNQMAAGSATLSTHTNKLTVTLNALHVKLVAVMVVARRVFATMGGWVATAADYEENINLFTVSMGKHADEAMAYAEAVQAAMGIDVSQWTRNQGIFMSIAKGFGLMEEQAYVMSRGLTELAYDLSSFFNISLDSSGDGALDKVKSAIAGELEPLRRLGFALDQATLQQVAYAHGVTESYTSMTQAEKALLRYTAMVEQATSMGAVGDLSRTIDTFSNQVRILKQRFTALGRAAGQAIIPALQAILPWVQAVIVLFTKAAQAVAAFFGFKMTKIDYSGLGGVADTAEKAETSLGGAGSKAKELRDYLMGIDELNVISQPDTGGGGGGGGAGLSDWASDWELESLWDKSMLESITSQVDAIVEKLEKALKPLKNILEFLWEFKELIVASFAIAALVKLWAKAKALWAWFLGIKFVDNFLNGFTLIRAVGGNVFESLRGGLDSIRLGMTKMQRVVVGAVAALAEFAIIKTVFKQLLLGTKKLGAGIAELVITVGAASVALYVALGPIGLVVAGLVALTAAAVGYSEANKEMIRDMVHNSVFDDMGSSLDLLSTQLETVTDRYKTQNDEVIRLSQAVEKGREEIDLIGMSLGNMTAALGLSGEVTREEVDALKGEFSALCSAIRENMENSADIILTSLAGALQNAVPEVQQSIQTLIGEYQLFIRETQGRAGEIEIEANRIYDSLVGMVPGSEEYAGAMASLNELYTELGYLQGGLSDAEWQWGQTIEKFNTSDVNWGSVDDAKMKIAEIGAAGAEALDAVAAARDAALKKIDEDIQYASKYGTQEDVQLLFDVRETLESNYAEQEAAIQAELTNIFRSITDALGLEANTQAENARAAFAELDWFGQFWNGSEENYAAQVVEAFRTDIYTPISTELSATAESLGLESEAIGANTVDGIMNGIESSWTNRSMPEQMNNFGLDALTGFANGISENQSVVTDATAAASDAALAAFADAQQSHSPSLLYAEQGMYAMQGAAQGVKDNAHLLTEALSGAGTQSAKEFGQSYAKDLLSGIESGINTTVTTATTTFGRYVSNMIAELSKMKNEFANIVTAAKQMAMGVNAAIAGITNGKTVTVTIKHNASAAVSEINSQLAKIGKGLSVTLRMTVMGSGGVIKAFAGGGIIPAAANGLTIDSGQLFIAREAGPELVAGIGRGRTAVMNNDQIVESVSNGVYRAVVDALSTQQQQDSGDVVLVLGDKEVYRAAKRGERASGYSLVSNPTFA